MKANGCIIQLDTLAFLSSAEVVGGKKEHVTTVSQLCFSRSTVLSSRQRTCLRGRIQPTSVKMPLQ